MAGVVVAAGAVAIVWWVNRSDGNGAITTTMAPTTAAPPTTEAGPSTTYAAPSTTAPSGGPTGFAGAWEMTDESGLNLIVVSEDAGSLVTIDVYAERADWVCSGSNPFYEEMRGSVEGNRVTAVAGWLKCLGEPAWITEFTFEWRRVGSDLVDSMERRWSASGVDPSTLYPGDPWWDAWHMQIDEAALAGARLDLGPGGGHDCRVTDQVTIEGEIVDVVECTGRIDSPTSDFHVVHGFFKEAGDTVEGFRDQWTGVELWVDGYQVPPAGYLDWTVDGLPAVSWAWMGTLHGAHRLEMVWRDHNVVVASTIVDVTFP